MTYCKWCGMESTLPTTCSWCGKALSGSGQTQMDPKLPTKTVQMAVEVAEERERKGLKAFIISCGLILIAGGVLIGWRFELYPFVTMGGLFLAGMLLNVFCIIPPFEDEWVEIGVPLVLVIALPALAVFLGYLVYGLVTKEMDTTIVWLLGIYLGMLTVLQIITIIAAPDTVSISIWLKFRTVEILSLVAVGGGWMLSGGLRPMDR